MRWAIMVCEECGTAFAVRDEPQFQYCTNCCSDDTMGTGEYLSNTLYSSSGKVIQQGYETEPTAGVDNSELYTDYYLLHKFRHPLEFDGIKLLLSIYEIAKRYMASPKINPA